MPLLHINSGRDGLRLNGYAARVVSALDRALENPGPIIIMLHGYKFSPGHEAGCPHRHILSLDPASDCWKAVSWPRELGFGRGNSAEGVGIAFGWPARGTIWQAYRQAEATALQLADLVRMIGRITPGRPVHFLAHSLGARVVLGALPHLEAFSVGRAILLSGAEFGSRARKALDSDAGRSSEIINVTSRENDLYDFMLESLISPPERGDWALSHGMPRQSNTLTLQMDHIGTLEALSAIGFEIAPPKARVCHWSGYLRQGVFTLYRALLRRREELPLAILRNSVPAHPEPRWSRFVTLPDIPLPLPTRSRASS